MNSIQRGAFALYRYLIVLFAAACVVQIFLAGRGVFGIRSSSTSKTVDKFFEDQKSLDPHRALGEILGLVAVILFLAALVVWRDRRLIAWTFGLAVATEVLQHAFAVPTQPWVAGLHPVTGFAILASAGYLARDAWRGSRAPSAAAVPAPSGA